MKQLPGAQLKCLQFVAAHPGGRRVKAFPFGYGYRFDAPELRRAPFRQSTLEDLIELGFISVVDEVLAVSPKGAAVLGSGQ